MRARKTFGGQRLTMKPKLDCMAARLPCVHPP